MAVRMLYFAWVREAIGTGEEVVAPPASVRTVAELVDWLASDEARGAALADRGRLRAAVDQNFVGMDASIEGAREIALFPPVTGG